MQKEHKYRPSLMWPLLLIGIGIAILLDNLNILNVDLWRIWRLWPVVLILAGIDLILGRRSIIGNILSAIITIAVVGVILYLLVRAPGVIGLSITERETTSIEEPLADVEEASLRIGFGSGSFDFEALSNDDSLIEGKIESASGRKPSWEINTEGDTAEMELGYFRGYQSWGSRGDDWDIYVSPNVSLDLDLDLGVGENNIDLSNLDLEQLQIDTGVGRTTIQMPDEGTFDARIDAGLGELIVRIPKGMAARIRVDTGVGSVNVPHSFDTVGDHVYESDDWDTNRDRVDINIDVGMGSVTIKEG